MGTEAKRVFPASTALILAIVTLMTAAGCRTYYVFPPVEVTTEKISPAFELWIENGLTTDLAIEPFSDFQDVERIVLEPSAAEGVGTVVVKLLTVGDNPVAQVVEGPYLEVESAGFGVLRLRTTIEAACPFCQPCDLRLDVRNASWFDDTEPQNSSDPPRLEVCITECSASRVVFRQGPASTECN